MATVSQVIRNVRAVGQQEIAQESIQATAPQYLEKQKAQLSEGLNKDGSPILPKYAPRTVQIKKRKGQRTDVVTLRDTGDFYQDTFLDVRDSSFVIDSANPKTQDLLDKYGEDIFGIGGDFKASYVNEDLKPVFQKSIKQAMKLK
jgi:hypothetical protein